MGVFENYKEINGEIRDVGWIEWVHPGIPNSPEIARWFARIFAMIFGHCLNCTALSGCYFAKFNMPGDMQNQDGLLHLQCHCQTNDISLLTLRHKVCAVCPIEKFTNYIFSDNYAQNGKKQLFENLGFKLEDSYDLKQQYEYQAMQKYMNGNYVLKNLDMYGQNINITIDLIGKNGRSVQFVSGWKVYPEGLLNCNTPLGGK